MKELVIGIDLALKHKHKASIWDNSDKRFVGKSFSFDRTFEGFEHLLERCLPKEESDVQLIFIMEPTSMAWLPLSCYLIAKGHKVYIVKTQKVSALRKYFGINKSDRLDSETLTKVYILQPNSLHSLYLPTAVISAMGRFCRQRARLVKLASSIKTRLWHIFTFVNPKGLEAFNQDKYAQIGRAFLRELINPYKIVALGVEGLTQFLSDNCHGNLEPEIPEKLFKASESAVKIYQEFKEKRGLPFDLDKIQLEVNIELDILEAIEEKIDFLDKQILPLYLQIDPQRHLQSFKGIKDVLAPIIYAIVGDISRFPSVRSFRGFLRFHPKKKQTTDTDKKGLRIVKSSLWLLKQTFYMAAEVARHWDPEFAAFYDRLIKRGLHHNQAICALANKLAGRVYAVMKRMADQNIAPEDIPYKLRDLDGQPTDAKTAKELIDRKYPSKKEQQKRQRQQNKKKKQTKKPSKKLSEPSAELETTSPVSFERFQFDNLSTRIGKTQSLEEILKTLFPQIFELEEKNIEQ